MCYNDLYPPDRLLNKSKARWMNLQIYVDGMNGESTFTVLLHREVGSVGLAGDKTETLLVSHVVYCYSYMKVIKTPT